MFSYLLTKAKDKVVTLLTDVCPCFDPFHKSSHKIEDVHRRSNKLSHWDFERGESNGKIFTIEMMKKLAIKGISDDGKDFTNECVIMEQCPWKTESCDMLLRVENSVFPVNRFLLSVESDIFKTILESIPVAQKRKTIVTLNGYDAKEIEMLLTFVYLPESEIKDDNVLILLKLANELMIEELVIRCEEYLLTTAVLPPVTLLQIADKYQLPSLEEAAAIKASKLPCVEREVDFYSLTKKQQEKVLNMSRNRYRSGTSTLYAGNAFIYETTSPSPELKLERKLKEIKSEFKGTLAFIPNKGKNNYASDAKTRT